VDLSVVEQRYRAVLAVERGEPKIVVAAQFGVSRQTLHTWLTRYRDSGLAGLMDRSHRPDTCPHQADAQIETRVCELRREHPWWGPLRIAFELARTAPEGSVPRGKSTNIRDESGILVDSAVHMESDQLSVDLNRPHRVAGDAC
jgi:transposase-like protein